VAHDISGQTSRLYTFQMLGLANVWGRIVSCGRFAIGLAPDNPALAERVRKSRNRLPNGRGSDRSESADKGAAGVDAVALANASYGRSVSTQAGLSRERGGAVTSP
jgi:hypothetical protein